MEEVAEGDPQDERVIMYLKKLSLTNFKNYTQADYQFSDKINCFVGNNGVGKTNPDGCDPLPLLL